MTKTIFLTAVAVLAMTGTASAQQIQYMPDSVTTRTQGAVQIGGGVTVGVPGRPLPGRTAPRIPDHQLREYIGAPYDATPAGAPAGKRVTCQKYWDTWFAAINQDCW